MYLVERAGREAKAPGSGVLLNALGGEGWFLPLVAKKLTRSPWVLNPG